MGEVLWRRVERRPHEVNALVRGVELAQVDRALAEGRGVMLAAAHHGPLQVGITFIRARYREALFLLREPRRLRGANVLDVGDGANRAAALVEARRHLRRGGLVYVAPDGVSGIASGAMVSLLAQADGRTRVVVDGSGRVSWMSTRAEALLARRFAGRLPEVVLATARRAAAFERGRSDEMLPALMMQPGPGATATARPSGTGSWGRAISRRWT